MAAVAAMDSPGGFPESPMEQDDVVYPCKGCGQILEEGKAFELAGNRWHIDCFRCNTCGTLLDSDANLLLLGDGSLICNNCTYSCSACGNKIEDLAILTGDQAFCANCFKCRNCKRKIDNLRYARTSQGIFCMSCHETLMARRRKRSKAAKQQAPPLAGSNNPIVLDKSLPALPPSAVPSTAFPPELQTPSEDYSETPVELSPRPTKPSRSKKEPITDIKRDLSPNPRDVARRDLSPDIMTLPASTYRESRASRTTDLSSTLLGDDDAFDVPLALDPTPVPAPSPLAQSRNFNERNMENGIPKLTDSKPQRDYFNNGRLPSSTHRDLLKENRPSSRSSSTERSGPSTAKASPHIAYQEKGRQASSDLMDTIRRRKELATGSGASSVATSPPIGNDRLQTSNISSPSILNSLMQTEDFKLQEVPKGKRSGSRRSSAGGKSPVESPGPLNVSTSVGLAPSPNISEPAVSPRPATEAGRANATATDDRSTSLQTALPTRADSLPSSAFKNTILRKDVTTPKDPEPITPTVLPPKQHERKMSSASIPPAHEGMGSPTQLNGGRSISKPMESPVSRSIMDAPIPPRSNGRPPLSGSSTTDSFTAPRAPPPPPPAERHISGKESISTITSDTSREVPHGASSGLPRYSGAGDFSMDEDMARIIRGEDSESSSSVLRRVSNAVSKHGRSFSDRGSRGSNNHKWGHQKSPLNGSMDISSPVSGSPDSKEENIQLRHQLRRAQQRIAELEAEKNGLLEKVSGTTDIKQMNVELREKRSTMAVLDTQREMVVRELEIMTDHLAKAKESNRPLNIELLKSEILQDFANSLQQLKTQVASQIEDLVQKRHELTDEISNLIQMKDKGFQEYESVSTKNAQLRELNAQLVQSIQQNFRDARRPNGASESIDGGRPSANGLGIYTHRPDQSMDLQTILSQDGSLDRLLHDDEAQPATVLTAPQVVNIRKGQPKKFNWKKGGQAVAKNVTKGLKGAFASNQQYTPKEAMHFQEGLPYGALPSNGEPSTSLKEKQANFGFFTQKGGQVRGGGNLRGLQNNSSSNNLLASTDSSILFGSDLTARSDYEKRNIPAIVTCCIAEVETRGMDVEGIYRKSGGSGQVKQVQLGFEKQLEYDVSDPDLDIHAVTSALKQYLRKLPIPLITFDVYDSFLSVASVEDTQGKIVALRNAISGLPKVHHDVLEFLVFHLARIMEHEGDNLMTGLNLAVVFAPTIMRPMSIEREMSDMELQRKAVQFMLENNRAVFGGSS